MIENRCPFRYYSVNQLCSQGFDNQCLLEKGHQGEHIKREIFPPPQTRPMSGWVNSETQVTEGSS